MELYNIDELSLLWFQDIVEGTTELLELWTCTITGINRVHPSAPNAQFYVNISSLRVVSCNIFSVCYKSTVYVWFFCFISLSVAPAICKNNGLT